MMAFFGKVLLAMTIGVLFTSCHAKIKYQEMTHMMKEGEMVYHPVYAAERFQFVYTRDQAGPIGDLDFVAWSYYKTAEHMGTHMDAPYHFDPKGRHVGDIPLEELNGPLVKIDISEKAKTNPRATLDIEDLLAWEKKYGRIPDDSFIICDGGWGQYWGNQDKFVGTTKLEEADKLNWPSFSIEAANWILENRNVRGLGTDTLACDIPGAGDAVHLAILPEPASKVCLENLAYLDKIPECGAWFYYNPLLMYKSTGVQIRAYATMDVDNPGCENGRPKFEMHGGAARVWKANLLLVAALVSCLKIFF